MKKFVALALGLFSAIIPSLLAEAQPPVAAYKDVLPADDPENAKLTYEVGAVVGALGFSSGGNYRVQPAAGLALGCWLHLGQHWGLALRAGLGGAGMPVAGEGDGMVLSHHAGVSGGYRSWGNGFRLSLGAEYASAHDDHGRMRVVGVLMVPRADFQLSRKAGLVITAAGAVGPGWDHLGHLGTLWGLRTGIGFLF